MKYYNDDKKNSFNSRTFVNVMKNKLVLTLLLRRYVLVFGFIISDKMNKFKYYICVHKVKL